MTTQPKAAPNRDDPKTKPLKVWFRASIRELLAALAQQHHTSQSDIIERAIIAYANPSQDKEHPE